MYPRLAIAALALTALAGCGGSTSTSSIPAGGTPTTGTQSATTDAGAAPAGCRGAQEPPAKNEKLPRPTAELDPARRYVATVQTNCGTFSILLDVKRAPNATASISYLAGKHYFDDTVFHRIVPDFVIQGGDPSKSGSGGPGYSTVDKPPRDVHYTTGVVAMAKTGDEPAGTAGSQFFVVTGKNAGLPPDYAVVGRVIRGLDVVKRIGKLGDQSEQPTATVVIEKFRVSAT
jgi:peptidyl-prolyl cis-trans isomerase B (cyclophilin B)